MFGWSRRRACRVVWIYGLVAYLALATCPDVLAQSPCPSGLETRSVQASKEQLTLYEQGRLLLSTPAWILKRFEYESPVAQLINRCSGWLRARTISDSLPERLNTFAFQPKTARKNAFITVSSLDQRMAMEKTGPYWHAYFIAFPDLKFVGAQIRMGHGLVTKDPSINVPADLAGKTVGMIPRPSSLRALAEIVLIAPWNIYDEIEIKELLIPDMTRALDSGDVDALFMPVGLFRNGSVVRRNIRLDRDDLRWLSLSVEDVNKVVKDAPVLAERITITPPNGATNGSPDVGLITFDVAFFTFAQTTDDVVYDFVQAMQYACPPGQSSCQGLSLDSMLLWPQLSEGLIHPGAFKYYKEQGMFGD